MNYQHAFHAGNFADVLKHAVLVRILLYLAHKPAPFRVVDTHAGAGVYDLTGDAAQRTGEWRDGVGRLSRIDPASPAGVLLAPYLALIGSAAVAAMRYPGSPCLAQALLRPVDRALFYEAQEAVRGQLTRALARDSRTKVLGLDGWTALGAVLPPPERRGLVLIDPPFEAADDFDRLADGFARAWRKWPSGIFMLWYPVKSFERRDAFLATVRTFSADILRVELGVAPVRPSEPLAQAGLLIANPPYVLAHELATLLPALTAAMTREGPGHWCAMPLAPDTAAQGLR